MLTCEHTVSGNRREKEKGKRRYEVSGVEEKRAKRALEKAGKRKKKRKEKRRKRKREREG